MSMRDEKKSESLEVRLPYSQKIAFMEACKEQGITASDALRAGIDEFLATREGQSQPSQFKNVVTLMKTNPKKTVGSLMAMSIGAALFTAMPSAAQDELFAQYDKNKDGVLTAGEISEHDLPIIKVLDKNGDGQISPDEFEREAEATQTLDTIEQDEDGNDVRIITVESTKLSFTSSDRPMIMTTRWAESVDLDASQEEVDAMIEKGKANNATMAGPGDLDRMIGLTHELGEGPHGKKVIIRKTVTEDGEQIEEIEEILGSGDIERLLELETESANGEGKKVIILKSTDSDDVMAEDIKNLLEEHGIDDAEGTHKIIIRKEMSHEETED